MILQISVEVECPTYGLYSGSYVLSDYRGRIRLARTRDQTIEAPRWAPFSGPSGCDFSEMSLLGTYFVG